MTPQSWNLIDKIFKSALERTPAERAAFLIEACDDNDELKAEVESLISAHEQSGEFLDAPAHEVAHLLLSIDPVMLAVGQTINQYEVLATLGVGGMGEVYLAHDARLRRKVALKLLPLTFTNDAGRVRRFQREARSASALNHPNILVVHEIGRVQGRDFIATEFVEGETLRQLLDRTDKLTMVAAVDLAVQICSALKAAHEAGVVHRDVKPANVMVRTDGLVKVLDFGLAKFIERPTLSTSFEFANTGVMQTDAGLVMGTPPYMSPQQVKGEIVDGRSDLFSLGAILYECVAGRAPFTGSTAMEVCAQVIHVDPPPPSQFNSEVTPQLNQVILKALAKEADRRHQSAGQLLSELRAISDQSLNADRVSATRVEKQNRVLWIWVKDSRGILQQPVVLVLAILVALIVALFFFGRSNWLYATAHQPSSGALYWYEVGMRALRRGGYYDASKALEQAVAADDQFVLAHARLAEAYTELDYPDKANREILRARSMVKDLSRMQPLEALYMQAITSTVLRDFATAIKSYQQIADQAPDTEKAQVLVELGHAFENNEETDKAIQSYLEAARLAPSDAAAFLRLGILYGRRQELASARESLAKAQALYENLSNLEGVTEVLYQRGFVLKTLNQLQEAREQLERALDLTKVTANQYQRIRVLLVLSSVSAADGQMVQSELQATQAIEFARANGMENHATEGLIWLGNSFLANGKYADADKHYLQALELARRNNGQKNEAWALMQLGSLRSLQSNNDESLRYIEQALPFYRKGGYRKYLAQGLTLLGRVQSKKGDYRAALQAFEDQLQIAKQVGDRSQMAFSEGEIGSVLALQERYPEALRHFDESYQVNESLKDDLSVGYALANRASVLWQLGRDQEARAALKEASAIAERTNGRYRQLFVEIKTIAARLELSLWRLREAVVASREALNLDGTQFTDIAVQAKYTLGLALAYSGEARAGKRQCEEAVDLASHTGDPQLLSGALLAFAETMLETGELRPAVKTALQAQSNFARDGQEGSEWRAWLIAARGMDRLGDTRQAREYALKSDAVLSHLTQKWEAETSPSYLARQDVQHCHKQLVQLLKHQL